MTDAVAGGVNVASSTNPVATPAAPPVATAVPTDAVPPTVMAAPLMVVALIARLGTPPLTASSSKSVKDLIIAFPFAVATFVASGRSLNCQA